jgi:hypothetical protein
LIDRNESTFLIRDHPNLVAFNMRWFAVEAHAQEHAACCSRVLGGDCLSGMAERREEKGDVVLVPYKGEEQLSAIQSLIDKDLSEPYSIFTYRYFLLEWPHLCFLAIAPNGECVGTVVSKLVRSQRLPDEVARVLPSLCAEAGTALAGHGLRLCCKG